MIGAEKGRAGSTAVAVPREPFCANARKFALLGAPHRSPPVARLSCAAGFRRSQSGLKLPLSTHARFAVCAKVDAGLVAM